MKKVSVRFEEDKSKSDIDVVFTASEEDGQIMALMDRVRDPLAGTLTVYDSSSSAVKIAESDIVSISTHDKRLDIMTGDGTYELRMPLYGVVKMLHPGAFMQISRYEVINLDKVKRFDFSIAGQLQIEMKNGMITWASRRFISEIKRRLKENRR
jgi:DNA-binding LytR/AlgR family response regulator